MSFQKVCSQASKTVQTVRTSSCLRPDLWFVTFLPPLTVGWLIRTNKTQLWLIFLLQFYIYDIGSGKSISRVKGLSDVCCSVVYHPLYAQVCYLRDIRPSTTTTETAKKQLLFHQIFHNCNDFFGSFTSIYHDSDDFLGPYILHPKPKRFSDLVWSVRKSLLV